MQALSSRSRCGLSCSAARRPGRTIVKVSANLCPYSTLGVQANASDKEIKSAYRQLVLQYHPDVNSGQSSKFMTIQQAYELLTGRSRQDPNGNTSRRSDQAFHDWYWSFMQKRRWGGYKKNSQAAAAAAAAAADAAADAATSGSSSSSSSGTSTNAAPQSTLHSQLAGLRHRAAIRARKQQVRKASVSDVEASGPAQDRHPGAPSSGMEYDSTEMSDGCNMASGITDWQAAEAAHAAAASKRRFTASESHKQQVMQQLGDLHRMAAASQERGMW